MIKMWISMLVLCLGVLQCQGAFFRLYTRENPAEFRLEKNINSLKASTFDGRRKTVIVIHGYQEHGKVSWMKRMKDALLKQEDLNVITTDWSDKATILEYLTAAAGSRSAGNQVGELIGFLVHQAPTSVKLFHLVGFSLGAHAAGFAGQLLQNKFGLKLGRISGLDTAGPAFWNNDPRDRLDPGDADFVDAIHTDADFCGISRTVGHIDFYPNGGADQPQCVKFNPNLVKWMSCDHMSCPELFIESVLAQSPLRAFPCGKMDDFDRGRCTKCNGGQCPSMGYYADRTKGQASGKHFLYTNKSPPYSAYHYVLTFKTGKRWWAEISSSLAAVVVNIVGTKGNTGNVELKRRSVKAKSTETFVMPSPRDVGDLTRIDIKLRWLIGLPDKWDLVSVVSGPVWSNQRYTACFKTWVKSSTTSRSFRRGQTSC